MSKIRWASAVFQTRPSSLVKKHFFFVISSKKINKLQVTCNMILVLNLEFIAQHAQEVEISPIVSEVNQL